MSDATPILHMLSPQKHMSPFDVNMAADAGWKVIVPYINVALEEVTALTQDAIFSRPPNYGVRTGFFIGGKDAILALDMMDAAQKALVPPFGLSTFADPAGSFTTAAAMVACVERVLRNKFNKGWKGTRVAVFGATGVVGFASSIITALEGAQVTLVAHRGVDRVIKSAEVSKQRFGVDLIAKSGETEELKRAIIADAEVIFAAAAAGVRVISAADKALAKNLLVVADVNAVPPPGVEGMELFMDGAPLPGCNALGVGPLAIGDIKYKTEFGLFKRMLTSDKPVHYDFRAAFELARTLTALDDRNRPHRCAVREGARRLRPARRLPAAGGGTLSATATPSSTRPPRVASRMPPVSAFAPNRSFPRSPSSQLPPPLRR